MDQVTPAQSPKGYFFNQCNKLADPNEKNKCNDTVRKVFDQFAKDKTPVEPLST